MQITIVEDNIGLANGIAHFLKDQGHAVTLLDDGRAALEFLMQEDSDIIILDINLPSLDGLSILKSLRKANKTTPIILLSARDELQDRVNGLDTGADDYIVKPSELEELDARIRALSRRKPMLTREIVEFGNLNFDRTARQVSAGHTPIALPRRELAAFECLFDRQNSIVTKAQLTDFIYGVGTEVDENIVEIYVSRLRKKLATHGVSIKAARGLGYMMSLTG